MLGRQDNRMHLTRSQPQGPLVGQLLELESADERDHSRLGRLTIRVSGNKAQGQRTDLESAIGDEEESLEGLEGNRWGFC
jgi:hypothetical protein